MKQKKNMQFHRVLQNQELGTEYLRRGGGKYNLWGQTDQSHHEKENNGISNSTSKRRPAIRKYRHFKPKIRRQKVTIF